MTDGVVLAQIMIKMGPQLQRCLGAIMRPLRAKTDHFDGEV